MDPKLEVCVRTLHQLAKLQNWGAHYKQQSKFILEWKGGSTPQALAANALYELSHLEVPVPHPTQSIEEFFSLGEH